MEKDFLRIVGGTEVDGTGFNSRFLAFRVLLILALLGAAAVLTRAQASPNPVRKKKVVEKPVIGKVVSFSAADGKTDHFWNEKQRATGKAIHEGDQLLTVNRERVEIALNDGTKLRMGPNTRIVFKNWEGRDSDNRRVRQINFYIGTLWVSVKKIYSQVEPFLINHPNAVVAVQGTEFICEAQPERYLHTTAKTREELEGQTEFEVHTLEGQVRLARTRSGLRLASQRVEIPAGKTTLVRGSMSRPQRAHDFDLPRFQDYIAHRFPETKVIVGKPYNLEERSRIAGNLVQPSVRVDDGAERAIASEGENKPKLWKIPSRRDEWLKKPKR